MIEGHAARRKIISRGHTYLLMREAGGLVEIEALQGGAHAQYCEEVGGAEVLKARQL